MSDSEIITIITTQTNATIRKLRKWSAEIMDDLKAFHDFDVQDDFSVEEEEK
jgi:hypothetical protein